MTKIAIFDLDKTLWDHPDISSTFPPYTSKGPDVIEDLLGEEIRLETCVRNMLSRLKRRGIKLCVASWNMPEKALAALRAFHIDEMFDYIVIEPHPYKERMIRKIIERFSHEKNMKVYFFDDNPEIVRRVRELLPSIKVFLVGDDVKTICEAEEILIKE